jgi:hypothetical protein
MARTKLSPLPKFSVGDIVSNTKDIGTSLSEPETEHDVTFGEGIVKQVVFPSPGSKRYFYMVDIPDSKLNEDFKKKYLWIRTFTVPEDYIKSSKDIYVDPEVFI